MTVTFQDQFTQTLLTLEDIESLMNGLVPNKALLVDISSCVCSDSRETRDEGCEISHIVAENTGGCMKIRNCESTDMYTCDESINFEQMETYGNITPKNVEDSLLNSILSVNVTDKRREAQVNLEETLIRPEQQRSLNGTNNKNYTVPYNTRSSGKEFRTRHAVLPVNSKITATRLHLLDKKNDKKSDEDVNISCRYCAKQFASKKSLQKHIWIHERSKEYSCERCGKQFLRANELCLHARTHTGEKPFSCGFCEKPFSSSSALRRHQLVHSRDEDSTVTEITSANVCNLCGKTFSQKGNLKVHMKIHSGRYDHVCKTCLKQFITSGDLKRHERVHSREKPYTCDKCKKSFSASSTLVCHMRSHSGERPYLCGVCGAVFSILGHLKQHNKIHARGDLWPKKKGAAVTNQNFRRKISKIAKRAGGEEDNGCRKDDEKSNRRVAHPSKYMSVESSIIHPGDMFSAADFVNSVIQSGNSNTTSLLPYGTVGDIKLEKGSDDTRENLQDIQLTIYDSRNFQRTDVGSGNHHAASGSEKLEAVTTIPSVTGPCYGVNVQLIACGENTPVSDGNMLVSEIIPNTVSSRELVATAGSCPSFRLIEQKVRSAVISNQSFLPLSDVVNKHLSITAPLAQGIGDMENPLLGSILSVSGQRVQYLPHSFCTESGINVNSGKSCVDRATVISVLPAKTCPSVCALTSVLPSLSGSHITYDTSVTYPALTYSGNAVLLSDQVGLSGVTSDVQDVVLTSSPEHFSSSSAAVPSSTYNGVNHLSVANAVNSNMFIGHSTASEIHSLSTDHLIMKNVQTSPFISSFPGSYSNILSTQPEDSEADQSSGTEAVISHPPDD